ncbi:MAG: gamma-glutamyltransferase [Gemmatimonadetes bacterium]|nr:gamma-glutamyltransferase [Gemmatimonadota bacterium]
MQTPLSTYSITSKAVSSTAGACGFTSCAASFPSTRPTPVVRGPDRPVRRVPPTPRSHAGTFGVRGGPIATSPRAQPRPGHPDASLIERPARCASPAAGTPTPSRRRSRGKRPPPIPNVSRLHFLSRGVMRIAQADAGWWRSAPQVLAGPARDVATAEFARDRAQVAAGDEGTSFTSHLSVVDAEGNAVSATTTVGVIFGSGLYRVASSSTGRRPTSTRARAVPIAIPTPPCRPPWCSMVPRCDW